jgi:hypothetical protein
MSEKNYTDLWGRQSALTHLCRAIWQQATKIEGLYYESENERVRIRIRGAENIFVGVKGKDTLQMLSAVIERIQIELGSVSKQSAMRVEA